MPQYSGIWTEQAVMQAVGAGNWANVPGVPTGVTATVLGATSVSVAFTAPTFAGIPATITSYTVTSSPGGITASGASSPITVTGLTTGTPYTFTVTATNASGTSSPSAASNSVTPVQIDYIEDVFSTYLYTGNGTSQTITNGINLSTKGGLVWVKSRSSALNHLLVDTARGANRTLASNTTAAQIIEGGVTAFNTTGFDIDNIDRVNTSSATYASWTFREQAKFFDIVTYTGDGNNNRLINHNLGSTPGCVIVKCTSHADTWAVWHRSLTSTQYSMALNTTAAQGNAQANQSFSFDGSVSMSSTQFVVSQEAGYANSSDKTYVAYLFAHNAGGFGLSGSDNVISCGSFTGTSFTVNLGYEPQWIMFKRSDAAGQWFMLDTMRGDSLTAQSYVKANASDAESTNSAAPGYPAPTSTGFYGSIGPSGAEYIYIAIRRGPMKVPTSGTSVFEPKIMSATQANLSITGVGFPPDLVINGVRSNANYGQQVTDRLRGVNKQVFTEYDSAESTTNGTAVVSLNMNGISLGADTAGTGWNAYSGYTSVKWIFGRAPSFFDEVCYTGTGSATTVSHNLQAVPQLILVKQRTASPVGSPFTVYSATLGNTGVLFLNSDGGNQGPDNQWNSTTPTSSVFSLGSNSEVNYSGSTYVAYLFATCAGVSKVGSYTGTGATQTIDCGFAAGARFVLIKRSGTGDWYVYDSARGISSSSDPYLFLNSAAAEVTGTNYVDTTSVGFQVTAAAPAGLNANGGTYIFLAIA